MGLLNLFKKTETLFGRDNYLQHADSYEANDHNWMLLLSAPIVEAADMACGIQQAKHDCLSIYPEALTSEQNERIKSYCSIKSPDDIPGFLNRVSSCWPLREERYLYRVINAESQSEVREINKDFYDDDPEISKILIEIWYGRKKYHNTRCRIAKAADVAAEIRTACYLKHIDEATAWKALNKLTNFIRPSLSAFDSWDEYFGCFKNAYKLLEYGNTNYNIKIDDAIKCLTRLEPSPIHKIPYSIGLDPATNAARYKAFSYKKQERPNIRVRKFDAYLDLLKEDDKQPLWDALNAITGKEPTYDINAWLSSCCATADLVEEDVLELPDLYPTEVYAFVLRANLYRAKAYEARGNGTADTVGEENYDLFYKYLQDCAKDAWKAYDLAPNNLVVLCGLLDTLPHFDSESPDGDYQQLLRHIEKEHPGDYCCIQSIAQFRAKKWGGSHEEVFNWARNAILAGGSYNGVLLFDAAQEYWFWFDRFEKDEEKANAILNDEALKNELNVQFDVLMENFDEVPNTIASAMLPWYFNVNDYDRFRQIVQRMQKGYFSDHSFYQVVNDDFIDLLMTTAESY